MTGLPLIIDSTARSRPLKFENRIPGPFFFDLFPCTSSPNPRSVSAARVYRSVTFSFYSGYGFCISTAHFQIFFMG